MALIMIGLRVVAVLLGVALTLRTMASLIRTFVVPRAEQDGITRVVFQTARRTTHRLIALFRNYTTKERVAAYFAPTTLVVLPGIYMILLGAGYALIYWGLGAPTPLDALLLSGSSLLTLGTTPPQGAVTALLAYSEATTGLIVIATLIAYLPTIYSAFSSRETEVTLLDVRAGSPPSAVEMLERMQRLGLLDDLHELWETWEVWFGEVEESHTSLAALVFFRSPQPRRHWLIAAAAVLDAAVLHVSTLDVPHDVQADLTIRAGYLALRHIADFFRLPYTHFPEHPGPEVPLSVTRPMFDEACARLAQAGVPVKPDRDKAWHDFVGWRANYDAVLVLLARLTMAPAAPWTGERVHEF